jgi:hypothetical protein
MPEEEGRAVFPSPWKQSEMGSKATQMKETIKKLVSYS